MVDRFSDENYYAVEHYQPKTEFPALETEYTNLFYSCGTCNGRKGSYVPDDDQEKRGEIIPNPCDHVMHSHLRSLPDGTVSPHSHTGKWTIDHLDLNAPGRISKRLFFLSAKNNFDKTRRDLLKTLSELRMKELTMKGSELSELASDIHSIQCKLEDVEVQLFYLQEGCNH